jgi:hypothetical protein
MIPAPSLFFSGSMSSSRSISATAFRAVDIQHVELADQISKDDCAFAGHSA